MKNKLKVSLVVGSWKAYTEAHNDKALGSNWLDMDDFDSIQDIYAELKQEGFTKEELEETFIQDYECDIQLFTNCDYVSIDKAFEILEKIDYSQYSADEIKAFYEIGNDIDDIDNYELYLYPNCETLSDLAYEFVQEGLYGNIPDNIANYIDYEAMGRDLGFDSFYETSKGILEVR